MSEWQEERSGPAPWVYIVGSLVVLGVLGGGLLFFLKAPDPVPTPKSFTTYTASDKSFVCQAPAGWETISASAGGVEGGALFKKGDAKIDITADLAGSLMGDIAASADRMAGGTETAGGGISLPGVPGADLGKARKPPVEKLHDSSKKSVAKKFGNYDEKPTQTVRTQLGEGRFSEFTAGGTGLFDPKLHGYRVTFLPTERRITIIAVCRETDWAALKPAFETTIQSLTPGGG